MKNDFRSYTDPELWQALKRGEDRAVALLMKRFYRDLYNYGLRISKNEALTEDCIQDLFVELWLKREKLGNVQVVKMYLVKSLRRQIARKTTAASFTDIDVLPEYEGDVVFSHEDFLIREQNTLEWKHKLLQALNSLSPRQREAIYLRFFDNLTYEQIAQVMSLAIPTLYDLLSKAVKKLKAFFASVVSLLLFCVYLG